MATVFKPVQTSWHVPNSKAWGAPIACSTEQVASSAQSLPAMVTNTLVIKASASILDHLLAIKPRACVMGSSELSAVYWMVILPAAATVKLSSCQAHKLNHGNFLHMSKISSACSTQHTYPVKGHLDHRSTNGPARYNLAPVIWPTC